MLKLTRSALAVMICLSVAGPSALAAEKVEKKPVVAAETAPKAAPEAKKPGKGESLRKAIADLKKEVADFAKNPAESKLRSSSDYFTALPEDTTVDQLLGALESRQGEPVVDAYVRWQLLSGLPSTDLEPKQLQRLFNAYRSAPQPVARFGVDARERQQFEAMLKGGTEKDEEAAQNKLDELRKNVDTANGIITKFRSGLISRFPRSRDTMTLLLHEAQTRMDKGLSGREVTKSLTEMVHMWIVMDSPKVQDMQAVGEMLHKAKDYKGQAPIHDVKWDSKTKSLKIEAWGESISDDKAIPDIIKELTEAIQNPGANELKFKDDEAKPKSRYKK